MSGHSAAPADSFNQDNPLALSFSDSDDKAHIESCVDRWEAINQELPRSEFNGHLQALMTSHVFLELPKNWNKKSRIDPARISFTMVYRVAAASCRVLAAYCRKHPIRTRQLLRTTVDAMFATNPSPVYRPKSTPFSAFIELFREGSKGVGSTLEEACMERVLKDMLIVSSHSDARTQKLLLPWILDCVENASHAIKEGFASWLMNQVDNEIQLPAKPISSELDVIASPSTQLIALAHTCNPKFRDVLLPMFLRDAESGGLSARIYRDRISSTMSKPIWTYLFRPARSEECRAFLLDVMSVPIKEENVAQSQKLAIAQIIAILPGAEVGARFKYDWIPSIVLATIHCSSGRCLAELVAIDVLSSQRLVPIFFLGQAKKAGETGLHKWVKCLSKYDGHPKQTILLDIWKAKWIGAPIKWLRALVSPYRLASPKVRDVIKEILEGTVIPIAGPEGSKAFFRQLLQDILSSTNLLDAALQTLETPHIRST